MIQKHPRVKIEHRLKGDGRSTALELLKQAHTVVVHDKWTTFVMAIDGRYCEMRERECWSFVTLKYGVEVQRLKTSNNYIPKLGEIIIWRLGIYGN